MRTTRRRRCRARSRARRRRRSAPTSRCRSGPLASDRADAGARRDGPRGARDRRGAESRGPTSSAPKRASTSCRPTAVPARSSTIAFGASDPLAERGRAHRSRARRAARTGESGAPRACKTAHADVAPAATVASAPPPPPAAGTPLRARCRGGGRLRASGGAGSGAGGTIGLRWQPGRASGCGSACKPASVRSAAPQAAATDLGGGGGPGPVPRPAGRCNDGSPSRCAPTRSCFTSRCPTCRRMTPSRSGARTCSRAPPPCVEGQLAVSPTLALVLGAGRRSPSAGRTSSCIRRKWPKSRLSALVVDGGPGCALLDCRSGLLRAPVAVL